MSCLGSTKKLGTKAHEDTWVQIIANLAVLLEPFLPFSSGRIKKWLRCDAAWAPKGVPAGYRIPEPEILFERLERGTVEVELARIGTQE